MTDISWSTERRKIRDLIPWPRNPRQIKGEQVRRLQESVEEFGQFETVAVGPGNEVYNGHQRLKSWGAKFGPDYEVEVRVSSRPLTEKEREKLTILAHKGAAGEWDFDTLANEFEFDDLIKWGFTEKELGFGPEPRGEDAGAQVDKAEELRVKWGVESGQLWRLGEHRIICGDCTDRAVVERVMGGEKANLIVTDPPYGVDYEGGSGNEDKREKLSGDDTTDLYPHFLSVWMGEKEKKAAVYIWFAGRKGRDVFDAVENAGLTVRALLIWNKVDPHYGTFMAHYMQKHEPCLYCVTPPVDWYGPTNEVTVWDIKQPSKNENHPTEKPIECMERPIKNSSKIGDIVADPFSGSGTTLIACERLSRKCRAVEISPAYVAVAIQRWVDMTGGTPEIIE